VPKVEKEDVDLTLSLKPNISNSNYVTMKIDIESSTPQIDPQSGLPKVNKRKTSQLLTVKNKQTVVVSGLVQSTEFERYKKIPLLGDIPIIGWLFRNSEIGKIRNNLVIFLTPHIIHGADDLAAVYQHRVRERDEFMEQIYGSRFKDDRFYAMLPTQDDGMYRPDERDKEEKERREQMLREMNEDTLPQQGIQQSTSPVEDQSDLSEPVSVPMTAGGGDNSGGAVMGTSPPPPPPPSDGGDVPMEAPMIDEPPPPPPEEP
jgi:general secretion pathway protein D